MSMNEYRNTAYAWREFMRRAAVEIEHGGEIKPARVLFERADRRVRILGDTLSTRLRMNRRRAW
jgi:hypothetical protein